MGACSIQICHMQSSTRLSSGSSYLTKLLIDYAYRSVFHGRAILTYNQATRQIWMIGERTQVKAHIRRCPECIRARPRSLNQVMGSLPAERIVRCRPFLQMSLDYASSILVRASRGKGQKGLSCYIHLHEHESRASGSAQ